MGSIHFAARNGNLEKVRTLIHNGVNANDEGNYGKTPLHYSAFFNHTDIAKLLISAGADVNAKEEFELTALHISSKKGYTDIVKTLISAGADVNAKDFYGSTSLHFSVFYGYIDIVKLLISAGAVVDVRDRDGSTPLSFSANKGHTNIMRALISAGADVNAKALNGKTPLHCSVVSGYVDLVRILISAGADVNVKDIREYTPLLYSYWNGLRDINILKALISAGADASVVNEKMRFFFASMEPNSPMHEVIKYTLLYNTKTNLGEIIKHSNKLLYKIWCECEKHVEYMKETWLGFSCTSFYVFVREVCENKLALYMSEQNFGLKTDLERSSYFKMFPMYAEDIQEQFKKGSERASLLHKSRELMMLCFCHTLPPELIRKICECMTNADMQTFLSVNNIFLY